MAFGKKIGPMTGTPRRRSSEAVTLMFPATAETDSLQAAPVVMPRDGAAPTTWRHRYQAVLISQCLALLVMLVAFAIDRAGGIRIDQATRDTTVVLKGSPWIGWVSGLGIVVWTFGGGAIAFAARHARTSASRHFAGWMALITLLLVLDDLYMLHEQVPLLGIRESIAQGAHGVLLLAVLFCYRTVLPRRTIPVLVWAGVMFMGSIVIDKISPMGALIAEDGLKLMGIAAWTVFLMMLGGEIIKTDSNPS